MRIAVLFWRLGPYHHARLNAAAKLADIVGIETTTEDRTYAWEKVSGATAFTRVTLLERYPDSWKGRQELRQRLGQALNEIRPDAVAVPGWSYVDALSGMLWCHANRVPCILMSESAAEDEARTTWKEALKRCLMKSCSAGLAGGKRQSNYLRTLGMAPDHISLGYDAVDNHYFAEKAAEIRNQKAESGKLAQEARPPTAVLRLQHSLPEKYFLASARFLEKKNLPRLIQAYAKYREKAETLKAEMLKAETGEKAESRKQKAEIWDLVLLGDGPLRCELERLISDLRLQSSVRLPGFKQYPELPAYYGLASAFIHPSTTEQWGLVVNEAMASGLPVLVSNRCGCALDLVQEGINGFTFDPYNVEQLAQLMFRISAFQPIGLSAFGGASRTIIANWGPERFAQGLKAAAEKALEVGPPKANWLNRLLLRVLLLR
jgi:glycosyltransferase involved in cell wall biosynthesis